MPLPPAHLLAGAAVAELTRPAGGARWRAWAVGAAFALLPDMDKGAGILLGLGGEFAGVFTHTLVAVLLATVAAWLVAGRRWALVAGGAYLSHLVVDLFERREMTSVQPLWPLSDATAPTLVAVFPSVPYTTGEGTLAAARSLLAPDVLPWLLAQSLVGLALLLAAVAARAAVRRWRGPR